jgi:hypothetical protein
MVSITLKQPIRLKLQHHMNSLHFYSFMCRLNISRARAMKAAKMYEKVVHSLLYA